MEHDEQAVPLKLLLTLVLLQFMEEQLREAAEFEAQQSRLKLKHVRTLQSIMATRTWRKEEEVRVERNRKLSKVDEEDEEEVGRSDMMDSDEGNTERIVSTVISDLECPGCNKVSPNKQN